MHTVKIARHLTVTFTGSVPAFVATVDDLLSAARYGQLDSRDAGDAVAAVLFLAQADTGPDRPLPWRFSRGSTSITVDYEDDLYHWSPRPE